jgi:hypothetical protein
MISPLGLTRYAASRLGIAVLLCAFTIPLPAQTRYLVDEPGVWKPWKGLTAIASARTERGATPAEVKAFEATLLELNAILRRAPGVASPRGYSVETWGHLSSYHAPAAGQPPGRTLPLAGALTFGAFPIFEYTREGRIIREDSGETALFDFTVNLLEPEIIGGPVPAEWDGVDTDAFMQPAANGELMGFPRFGDIVVLKKRSASLWAPVSLQASLDLVSAAYRSHLTERHETAARLQADYDRWKTPAKRAERAAGYKSAAALMPDAAKYLASMEALEKQLEVTMAAAAGPDSPTAKEVSTIEGNLAGITAWLGELSATERQAPACYAATGSTLRARFRAGASPDCRPLAQPNRQFFAPGLSRTVAQVVILSDVSRCFDHVQTSDTAPWGCTANRQLLQTMDRQAVLDWLR